MRLTGLKLSVGGVAFLLQALGKLLEASCVQRFRWAHVCFSLPHTAKSSQRAQDTRVTPGTPGTPRFPEASAAPRKEWILLMGPLQVVPLLLHLPRQILALNSSEHESLRFFSQPSSFQALPSPCPSS